jgi:hypothetical protein
MPKNKKQPVKNKRKGKVGMKRVSMSRNMPTLDASARAYANLLADPCNAPLVHPTYSGSDGAYVVRFNTVNTYGLVATSTSGILHWIPGAINATGGLNNSLLYNESPSSATAATMTAVNNLYTPGGLFLQTNASNYRCIAACITVYWAGSELSRAGIVSTGNTDGALLTPGASVQPGQVFPVLTYTERVPDSKIELRWRPSSADQLFQSSSTTVTNPSTNDTSKNAALTLFYYGLPAGVGITVEMTAVYEYIPSIALGLAVSPNSRNTSNNTLDQVINALDSTGDWVRKGAMVASTAWNYAGPVVKALGALAL